MAKTAPDAVSGWTKQAPFRGVMGLLAKSWTVMRRVLQKSPDFRFPRACRRPVLKLPVTGSGRGAIELQSRITVRPVTYPRSECPISSDVVAPAVRCR